MGSPNVSGRTPVLKTFLLAAGIIASGLVLLHLVGLAALKDNLAITSQREALGHLEAIFSAAKEASLRRAIQRARRALIARTAAFILVGLFNLAFLRWMYGEIRREIRDREKALADSHRQEEIIRTTLHSIGDGVIVTDAEGKV